MPRIISENIISKRHHYLPVFYLNGFCDSDGLFHVFDKIKDEFLPKCTPESKFYIKHLNNYIHKGKPIFSYEEAYFSEIDSKGSQTIREIINADISKEDTIPLDTKVDFIRFLTNLYWRSPKSNKTFVELIKKEGLNNQFFRFVKSEKEIQLKDEEMLDIKNQILSDDEIKKIFRPIMPYLDSNINEMCSLLERWTIYDVYNSGLITGDSPIINNNKNLNFENVFDNMIFPVSANKLLIFKEKSPKFFDTILFSYVNIATLFSAERFICAPKKETIINALKQREELAQKNKYESVVDSLFSLIEFQSQFDSFEKYLAHYNLRKKNT